MINFNQLRAFYEVAKSQSIKDTSHILNISQPAISTQIKSFEGFCELKLFKRKGRRIFLNDAGHLLLQHCREIFELEKNFEQAIRDLHGLNIGILKFGTSKTYARYLMMPYINSFRSKYPNVKIVLDEGSSTRMGHSVQDLQNELAIIGQVENFDALEFVPFNREDIVLVTSRDHPFVKKENGISFQELEGQTIAMRDEGSGTNKVVKEAFSRHGLIPHTLLETGNVDCIKDTVANGEAISFLLHSFLDEDLENGRLRVIPIRDERIYLDVNIVYLKNQPLTPAANEFLNILMEVKRDQKAKEA